MENVEVFSSSEEDENYTTDEDLVIQENQEIMPTIGMTFLSDEAATSFYNHHARQKGFGIRVKTSYNDKKTKEKRFVWLSCSKEGFKVEKPGVVRKRPIVRTGCNAHMKIKLSDSKWVVSGLNLNHNHICSPSKARRYKSHTKLELGTRKKLELHCDAGIRLNKSYQSVVMDAGGHENVTFGKKQARNHVDQYKRLKLKEGDAEAMHQYFTRMQQKNQNFFHVTDFDTEGRVKSVFWVDARSRSAYSYFGDVVTFDTTYRTNRYDLKFAPFVGVNHHGQSVLFGCGLLSDETTESFVWLFKAWLSAMSGCLPQAIITDQCKAMENAIKQVFPGVCHRLCLWHIMKKIPEKLGSLKEYKEVKRAMRNAVYNSLRISEFEEAWKKMIETYNLEKNRWLTKLYTLREQWVPVFLKNVFFAGMSTTQRSESMNSYFDGFVHSRTALREFISQFELAVEDKYEKESKADFDCFNSAPILKTSCVFEGQMAKVYTAGMFLKFQDEIFGMASCSKSELRVDGQITTYAVKERILSKKGKLYPPREYEVLFNKAEIEVSCICRLFQHKGILCRHALYVLNDFVDEIPSKYILSRWRKDFKRIYVENQVTANAQASNPVQRYDALFPAVLQLIDEGVLSESKFKAALDGIQEVTKKISNEDKEPPGVDNINHLEVLPDENRQSPKYLNPPQAKSVGRPPNGKRFKSLLEKNVEGKAKKQKKNETTTKTPTSRAPRKKATTKNVKNHDSTSDLAVNITNDHCELQDNMSEDDPVGCCTNDWSASQVPTTQNSSSGQSKGFSTDLLNSAEMGIEDPKWLEVWE